MSFVTASKNSFFGKAYVGDKKTLLAFNFQSRDNAKSQEWNANACCRGRAN
jgi:hypothetical protein